MSYLWFIRLKRIVDGVSTMRAISATSGTSAQARQKGAAPFRLCRRIRPQGAGRRADATATAEGAKRNPLEKHGLRPTI